VGKPVFILVFAVWTLAVLASGSQAFAQDKAALDRGEISVRSFPVAGYDVPRVVVQAVIEAPPSKVWEIIEDCNRYTERMSRIKAAKELERRGSKVICDVTIGLPFPISDLRATTESIHVVGPPTWSRTWTMLEGNYEKNDGSWVLTAFEGNPNRTLAIYTIHAIPHSAVPAWARQRAQRTSLPEVIERLREEVKK
jgi:ribosome-associated toxin RatA of RatAB toxin-antitoxin module